MGWTNELNQVYELVYQSRDDMLLPLSHSTANAQIEVSLDEHGNFKGANTVNKENAVTIIPVTEDSGSRSSGISPMPFADKLIYLAGDYPQYINGDKNDNTAFFQAYIEQLDGWRQSANSHPAVEAVFEYLSRKRLMEDLVKSGVIQLDMQTKKLLPSCKINGILQEDAFVRFIVFYDDLSHEICTWKDLSLYESFIEYYRTRMENTELCYATGEILPTTYKHPSKIRNAGDKAKLFSSNDKDGYTYRGRFSNNEEAFSVSYDFSQKMHNALKWLIKKQGINYDSLTLVTWASSLAPIPDILKKTPIEDDWDDEEEVVYDSLPLYKERIQKYILGYGKQYLGTTKVMLLGLDAATPGRLSIATYEELSASDFLRNLESWHENSAWMRHSGKTKKDSIKSFSLFEIIRAAYGSEQNDRLECDEKLLRDQILRLIPCVMDGRPVPKDLINALYHKASSPLSYDKRYNHQTVIEVTCGLYRLSKKGEISMSYDPNEKDRSYLYGCLLAIADKAESDTYEEGDRAKRITNARRYWANFAQHPFQTWQHIEESLRPYLDRHPYRAQIEKRMQEVMSKFTQEEFANNSRLDTMYLLGYHHYMAYLYNGKQNQEDK